MSAPIRKTVVTLLLVISAVVALTVHKFTRTTETLDKAELRELGMVWYETPRTFAFNPLSMVEGQSFTNETLEGEWTLMFFGFTFCPDVCPATLAHMGHMMKALRNQSPELAARVNVVLVSVDPKRDSPEKLDGYVRFFDEDFIGVTGDPANLQALAQQLNVAYEFVGDMTSNDYLIEHSSHVVLINPKGDYQGILKPPFRAAQLAEALLQVDQAF